MAFKKCPRCELNYIQDTQELCDVCARAKSRISAPDEGEDVILEICPNCLERPVAHDQMLCAKCLREKSMKELSDEPATLQSGKTVALEDMDKLDEIDLPNNADIPEEALREFSEEFTMESEEEFAEEEEHA